MKKNILAILSLFSITINAQLGVGTPSPKATLHIDGAKDNTEELTKSQIDNDFVFTESGKLGIRTLLPNSALHVNGGVSMPITKIVNSDYVVKDDDYTILLFNTTNLVNPKPEEKKSYLIELPDASSCKGRIYNILNYGGTVVPSTSVRNISNENYDDIGTFFNVDIMYDFDLVNNKILTSKSLFKLGTLINKGNEYKAASVTIQSDGENWYLISTN